MELWYVVFIYTCNCFCMILPEHEECLRDILELKWHVSFEGRQLSRIKDNLRITGLKHITVHLNICRIPMLVSVPLSNHEIDPYLNIGFHGNLIPKLPQSPMSSWKPEAQKRIYDMCMQNRSKVDQEEVLKMKVFQLTIIERICFILWEKLKLKAIFCTSFSHQNCTRVHQKRWLE